MVYGVGRREGSERSSCVHHIELLGPACRGLWVMGGVLRAVSRSRCTHGAAGAGRGRPRRWCSGALSAVVLIESAYRGLLARMPQLAVFSLGHARRVSRSSMALREGHSAVGGPWRLEGLTSQGSSAYRPAIIARINLQVHTVLRQCGVRMETRLRPAKYCAAVRDVCLAAEPRAWPGRPPACEGQEGWREHVRLYSGLGQRT
jgi:hypothetical protein